MMKIALIGYGKMGKAIESLLPNYPGLQIVARYNSQNAHELTIENLREADLAIEFTRPELAPYHLELCLAAGLPVVCGTTAWTQQHGERLRAAFEQQGGSLLWASNFSIGVAIFTETARRLAALMAKQGSTYHLEITEIHHTQKLDAPSGTAISVAQAIMDSDPHKTAWEAEATDNPAHIGIVSVRQADVKGTHHIYYQSDNDSIALSHIAHSRNGFAQGVIMAALWLYGKKGVFGIDDVLAGM